MSAELSSSSIIVTFTFFYIYFIFLTLNLQRFRGCDPDSQVATKKSHFKHTFHCLFITVGYVKYIQAISIVSGRQIL